MGGWKKWAGFVIWCVLLFLLSGQDFRSSKWSLNGSKIMYCHICGAMFPVEECRRKEP